MRAVETMIAPAPQAAERNRPAPAASPATSAGWSPGTPSFTRRNTAGRENFEGICAQIVADFVSKYDPKRERCWIAEMDGQNVGCVFLVKDTETVARLRLLLVDPVARGRGLGTKLTDECVRFARACGYRGITLWTHSVLTAARHIYERAGFRLTSSEKRKSFGQDVVSEYWDLKL